MQSYRTYAFILAAVAVATMAAVMSAAIWLEPLQGDLTRLGGHAENHFGWSEPQEIFRPPLALATGQDGPMDVAVFGDSFSWRSAADHQTPDGAFWTDHLVAMTGWRVGVAGRVEEMAGILAGERFSAQPPRAIVLQVVERHLSGWGNTASCETIVAIDTPGLAVVSQPMRPSIAWMRRTGGDSWEQRISGASDFLRKAALRALLPWESTSAPRMTLSRDDLFSSAEPSSLLYYIEDRAKLDVGPSQIARIGCRLHGLRTIASQLTGGAPVVLMIAPDKSTAYAEWIPAAARLPNLISRLAEDPLLGLLRLDAAMAEAVGKGARDVYLPNDTHWGSVGARLAAAAVRLRLETR